MVTLKLKDLKVGEFFTFTTGMISPTIWRVTGVLVGAGLTLSPFILEGVSPEFPPAMCPPWVEDPDHEVTVLHICTICTGNVYKFRAGVEVLSYTELKVSLKHLGLKEFFQLRHTDRGILQVHGITPPKDPEEPCQVKVFQATPGLPGPARILPDTEMVYPVERLLFPQQGKPAPETWDFAAW